jgi:hypothetical protein
VCESQLHALAIEAFALPQLAALQMRRQLRKCPSTRCFTTTSALARRPFVLATTAPGLHSSILLVDIPVTGRQEAGWRRGETSPDVAASGRRLARRELPIRPTGIGGDIVFPLPLSDTAVLANAIITVRMMLPLLGFRRKHRISESHQNVAACLQADSKPFLYTSETLLEENGRIVMR